MSRCRPTLQLAWAATEAAWRERVPALAHTIAQRDARHAYAMLTGLTSGGGGMVAAATMSLPERAREGRNYDYRYVWIRDQCYAGQAVAAAGAYPLLDDAVRFVRDRLLDHGAQLKPAYKTTGGRVPDQQQLDLAGTPAGRRGRQLGERAVPTRCLRRVAAAVRRCSWHDRLEARPGAPPKSQQRRSKRAGVSPTPGSGRSSPTNGHTAV